MTAIHADRIHATRIQADRISARRIGEGDGPSVRTLLSVALQSTLVPGIATGSGTPTYTRSTVATVTDFEGLVKNVLSGEARFMGARRVRNLLISNSENISSWTTVGSVTINSATSVSFDATGSGNLIRASLVSAWSIAGGDITIRFRAKGSGTLYFDVKNTSTGSVTLVDDGEYHTYSRAFTGATIAAGAWLDFYVTDVAKTVDITDVQVEEVTGQANQNPSEYVSVGVESAPYHGANVDGVKYFTTKNGNTVSSNVVTEATGAAIGASDYYADASGPFGYVAEGARTNLCLWGRDFSNAAWVKTNVTAVKDATGRDGAAAVASTLTATASNGTCRQTVTSASATRTISCDIKRKTGTGTIEMTVDGGSTYTDITSQINGSTWARVQVTQAAVTNPSVGFRIGTSGDAIYVDYFGLESASFASSRIHTTTAAVTRNAGSGSYASSSNITTANGVMVLEWTPPYTGMGTVALWGSYVDANNYTRIFHDGTNIVFRRRVSGVNYDATKALTYAAGTTYKIAARISDATGGDVFVAGVKGTNSSNTSALQLGANFSVGHDGNGANHSFAPIRNVKHYDTALTDVQVAAI